MGKSPEIKLFGEKQLMKKLKRLGNPKYLRKTLRKGTDAAATIVVKGVRKRWPQRTGLSAKAVTKKILSGRTAYTALIGIDQKIRGKNPDGSPHWPANIDHLIEFGHKNPDGSMAPALAPLRKGYEASSAAAEQKFLSKVAAEIEKEATR
jgi:hypothetical protein